MSAANNMNGHMPPPMVVHGSSSAVDCYVRLTWEDPGIGWFSPGIYLGLHSGYTTAYSEG